MDGSGALMRKALMREAVMRVASRQLPLIWEPTYGRLRCVDAEGGDAGGGTDLSEGGEKRAAGEAKENIRTITSTSLPIPTADKP